MHMEVDLSNQESLQRGARTFVNYCLSCHAAAYMRYNRMGQDLGISEDVLKANFMFGTDKVGRPNLYCKMAGFLPNHATLQSCQKFMVAMMDYVSSKSYAYIDQFNFIFDWDGVGRNNFDITVTKGLIDVSGKLYTGKIYRFYQLNMHWGASLVFGMIKPLIPQRGRDKIQTPGGVLTQT